jgi:peptidyl-prolyl cis-trans isomerase D
MVLKILRSKKVTKRVLIAILILIIPAFVLWGAGSITKRPKIIGIINGQKILPNDITESRQGIKIQILFRYFNDYKTLNQIFENEDLLNMLAWERLIFLRYAQKNSIKVSDKEVMLFVSTHPIFQRNGVFDNGIYEYVLKNNLSMSPRQFEELVRQNLKAFKFRQSILKDTKVSDEEILKYYNKLNDKVVFSYTLFDSKDFLPEIKINDNEVREYYNANKNMFYAPQKISVEYLALPFETAYERDAVISKLGTIYPQLRQSPQQFKTLAEDFGVQHITTDLFTRNDMLKGVQSLQDFQNAAFKLKVGEISAPVLPSSKEKGTIYIIRKISELPPKPKNFEQVRTEILSFLSAQKSLALAKTAADTLYDELLKENADFVEVCKKSGKELNTTKPVTYNSYIQNIGPSKALIEKTVDLEAGSFMPPVVLQDKVLLAHIDSITPADASAFSERKEQLKQTLLQKKQIAVMDKWFKDNSGKIQLRRAIQ